MKHQNFKLTTLCLLAVGVNQISFADTTNRQTLPLFQAKDISTLCDAKIENVKKQLKTFEAKPITQNTAAGSVLAEWDAIFASFEDFYGPVGLYSNVYPDEAVRKAADDCEIKISQFQTDILQNPKLYQQFKKINPTDAVDIKFKQDILNDFEKKGIQLPVSKQKKVKAILDELAKIEQEYSRNVRENKTKLEFTPAELKGLPVNYIENLKKMTKETIYSVLNILSMDPL